MDVATGAVVASSPGRRTRLGPAVRSVTMPSTMCTLRCARAASSGSWVTITTVVPAALISSISSSTERAICESRLPVGSSASSRRGLPASARAIAARCCWPPDNSAGKCFIREARPTRPSASSIRCLRSGADMPR